MKKLHGMFITALLCACASAPAQDQGPVVSFGLIGAQGDSNDLTHKPWGGVTAEVGWAYTLPKDYGFDVTPYIGWGRMPGEKNTPNRTPDSIWGPNSYNVTHWRAGFDLSLQPFESVPLTVVFGPSLHTWQVERVGVTGDPGLTDFGVKMGWRVGLAYRFSRQWGVGFRFTQSEWRAQRDLSGLTGFVNDTKTPSFIPGLNPCRPAYMTLMATYAF